MQLRSVIHNPLVWVAGHLPLRDPCKFYRVPVAEQAIPLLVSEINGLKEPEEAARKFYLMAGCPGVVQPFLDVSDMGMLPITVTTES